MRHIHTNALPAETEGLLLRWGSFYDLIVSIITLGQSKRLRQMTINLSKLKESEKILDVGCGTGGVTIPAKLKVGRNGYAAGVDPSPEMIGEARKKAVKKKLDIDFRLGVIESIPFPDGTFDVVTSSLMMHHLPHELQLKGMAEIYRVLKPGGRLLIVDTKRPKVIILKQVFDALAKHHGIKFGLGDIPEMLKSIGFKSAELLDKQFFYLGFVGAIK